MYVVCCCRRCCCCWLSFFHVDLFLLCISAGEIAAWMCTHCVCCPMRSTHFIFRVCVCACVYAYECLLSWCLYTSFVLFAVSNFILALTQQIDRAQFGLFDSRMQARIPFFESFESQCVSSVCCETSFVFLVVEASRIAAGKITERSAKQHDKTASKLCCYLCDAFFSLLSSSDVSIDLVVNLNVTIFLFSWRKSVEKFSNNIPLNGEW